LESILDRVGHARDIDLELEDARAEAQAICHELKTLPRSQRRYKRAVTVQTWRVLTPPPQDVPLTLCAADTVEPQDIVEARTINTFDQSTSSPMCLYHYNPKHRWYYFSDMRPEEVLAFVGIDFDNPVTCRVIHTGFDDPSAPQDAPPRVSLEARAFALFEE
jgi:hypothetical protein